MSQIDIREIQLLADQLISLADKAGAVLTIDLRPLEPLAMGHYQMVANVRPVRTALSQLAE